MRDTLSKGFAVIVAVAVTIPAVALGDPVYLPLSDGCTWSYAGPSGETETMTVVGAGQVMGATVQIIDYGPSTHNDPLQNYWTSGVDGDIFLWGFFRDEDRGWGLAYQPPLLLVDGPLFVGKTWACTTLVYSLPDEVPAGPAIYEFTVTWEGMLSVPAGEFPSIAIGFADPLDPPALRSGFGLDGRATDSRVDPDRWYSDGVGEVQYDAETLYQLVSFGITPVQGQSWTRIKQLYR